MAGRLEARRGCGQPNLVKRPGYGDTGGISSKNQWNPIEEGIYGADEGSEEAKAS